MSNLFITAQVDSRSRIILIFPPECYIRILAASIDVVFFKYISMFVL